MSIQGEIDRINQNIANTYSVLSEAGAVAPAAANSDNLPGTAASISAVLYGKAQTLSEEQKEQARNNIGALGSGEMGDISNVVFITVEDIDEVCNPQPDEPDVPPNTFQKVRAFQDGKEYILLFGYNGGYYCLSNEAFNDWTVKAAEVPEVTSTDAQITFTTVPVLFTARASGDGFTLHNGSNNIYGEAASHGTALRVNTEPGIVFTVDTSATGGFDSDEYIAKVDDQAVWLRSSFEAGNTCLKYESANTAVGIDYKDRDATYSTGFLSFVLYEKIS